jgi:hypothetical protein
MVLGDELVSFNLVVKKWDSSKIGGKRGYPKGKQAAVKHGLHDGKAGTSNVHRLLLKDSKQSRTKSCR